MKLLCYVMTSVSDKYYSLTIDKYKILNETDDSIQFEHPVSTPISDHTKWKTRKSKKNKIFNKHLDRTLFGVNGNFIVGVGVYCYEDEIESTIPRTIEGLKVALEKLDQEPNEMTKELETVPDGVYDLLKSEPVVVHHEYYR